MDLEKLCEMLKEIGIMEIILLEDKEGVPFVEFNGRSEADYFKITATNADFSEHGL